MTRRPFPAISFLTLLGVTIAMACSGPGTTATEASNEAKGVEQAQPVSAPEPSPAPEIPPLAKPLEVGSQEAKDDLYCAGILMAAHPVPMEAQVPVEQARLERGQTNALIIGETGLQKLIKEGVAASAHANQVLDAWADKAEADFKAGKPRLSLETCAARAEAIQPAE